MKQSVLIMLVFLIAICSAGAVLNVEADSISTAHGWGPLDEPDDALYFLTVNLTRESVSIVETKEGNISEGTATLLFAAPGDLIKTARVLSDGKMYYITNAGLWRHDNPGTYTPQWTNGDPILYDLDTGSILSPSNPYNAAGDEATLIASGNFLGVIVEDGGYIYYMEGTTLNRVLIGSLIPQTYRSGLTAGSYSTIKAFDVHNGVIYHLSTGTRAYNNNKYIYFRFYRDNVEIDVQSAMKGYTSFLIYHNYIRMIDDDRFYIGSKAALSGGSTIGLYGVYEYYPGNETIGKIGDINYENIGAGAGPRTAISYLDTVMVNVINSGEAIETVSSEYLVSGSIMPAAEVSAYDYDINVLNSRAPTYYNNSALDARYHMKINAGNTINAHKDLIADTAFELLVYGPGGQITGRYVVPPSSWEYSTELGPGYVNLFRMAETSRTVEFQAPPGNWEPGVYTYRMTEYTSEFGTRLVNQHTVTVTNQTGSVGGGTVDPETVTGTDIWDSKAFKAIMLICIPAMALGIVLSVPGAMVGLVLGVFLSFALGFLSFTWVIIIVLAIVASFAAFLRDMITGGGGLK